MNIKYSPRFSVQFTFAWHYSFLTFSDNSRPISVGLPSFISKIYRELNPKCHYTMQTYWLMPSSSQDWIIVRLCSLDRQTNWLAKFNLFKKQQPECYQKQWTYHPNYQPPCTGWLPVSFRIDFKVILLVYKALATSYMTISRFILQIGGRDNQIMAYLMFQELKRNTVKQLLVLMPQN